MHVTERFHRRDFGLIDVEIYSQKFTIWIGDTLTPDNQIFEMFCSQNQKDRLHTVK